MALGLGLNLSKPVEGYPNYRTRNSCTFVAGSSDYIVVANHSSLQVTSNDFSVSGWINPTVDASSGLGGGENGYAIMKAGKWQDKGFYLFYVDNAGDDELFQFHTNTDSANKTCASTSDIDHDTWYHVAATFDASETQGKIYVNGVLERTTTDQLVPTAFTDSVHIGGSSTNYISAKQCEILFWKGKTLSDSQITGLYNNGRPRHGLSCERDYIKAYWKLNADDDTGSNNVLDSSGNGRHGTTSGLASSDFDTTDVPK
jgi:hypothetical protein